MPKTIDVKITISVDDIRDKLIDELVRNCRGCTDSSSECILDTFCDLDCPFTVKGIESDVCQLITRDMWIEALR